VAASRVKRERMTGSPLCSATICSMTLNSRSLGRFSE
jgi:hypothetical protein